MSRLAGEEIIAPVEVIASDTSSSGSITGSETVTDTITLPVIAGHTYEIRCRLIVSTTVAGDDAIVRIREDSLTGTQIDGFRGDLAAASPVVYPFPLVVFWTALSDDAAKTFVVTVQRGAGSGNLVRAAGASAPTVLHVRETAL